MTWTAELRLRAPGKLFWLGEYAVLDGAPGIVAAVDRCVEASRRRLPDGTPPGVVLRGIGPGAPPRRELTRGPGAWAGSDDRGAGDLVGAVVAVAERAGWPVPSGAWELTLDSSALAGASKYGLGSSGAVAAGLAALLAPDAASDDDVSAAALDAHDAFQGGVGSGADVLASLHGGVLVLRGRRVERLPAERLMAEGVVWHAIWTGASADTRAMVGALRDWQARAPAQAERWRERLRAAAEEGVAALGAGDAARWLAAVDTYGRLEVELSAASGVGIVDERVARAMARARAGGFVAKPSGAGGGDVVVAFGQGASRVPGDEDAGWAEDGMVRLPLGVEARGVLEARREEGRKGAVKKRVEPDPHLFEGSAHCIGVCESLQAQLSRRGDARTPRKEHGQMNQVRTVNETNEERSSRLPGFYRQSRAERLERLVEAGFLDTADAQMLAQTGGVLPFETADSMIENVVGCFELPLGIGANFRINGRDHVVPMVVEEPSIVAAVSHAANVVRDGGGFWAEADEPVVTGQIQVLGVADEDRAVAAIEGARERLLAMADALEPRMVRRGGGARGLEVRRVGGGRYRRMLVVHLYVDARDAMGANLINTICEGLAPAIEELTGGTVFLRILSNLTDRRRVRCRCAIPLASLAWQGFTGEQVAEGIVLASEFAEVDPYRASTHNKGIMNGIDAVALACGQDWRAIEAGAHAWAARDGSYGPLATWRREGDALVGELDMPMAVGTVGGPTRLHPVVGANLRMLGVSGAGELACVLGAVGLAQNLAAIKALGSTGIQRGHMSLHARSVAASAGATGDEIESLAARLIRRGEIRLDAAHEELRGMRG